MKNLPTFSTYCRNTTAANALVFDMGNGLLVYFSYKTPVGFSKFGTVTVRENDWGPTTGKHLNAIDNGDKSSRIPGDQFESLLADELANSADVPA